VVVLKAMAAVIDIAAIDITAVIGGELPI